MFVALNEHGMLKPLIVRLWALNSIKREIEWETRGLHWESPRIEIPAWVSLCSGALPIKDIYTNYLNDIKIEFVKHSDGDHNGEHGWLDLNIGYAFST